MTNSNQNPLANSGSRVAARMVRVMGGRGRLRAVVGGGDKWQHHAFLVYGISSYNKVGLSNAG